MTSLSDIATFIAKNTRATPLSALVEAGGKELGLDVNRLRPNLVAIPQDDQHLIFSGLCGPSTSRTVTRLCKDVAWLRRTLALKEVPVPQTLKLPIGATETARNFVAGLGQSAFAAWQGDPDNGVAISDRNFSAQWKKLRSRQPDDDATVVVQPVDNGTTVSVTVAFGRIAHTSPEVSEEANQLAIQAVSILPGAHVADVTLAHQSDGSILVEQLDVLLEKWGASPYPDGVSDVVLAVMKGELGCAKNPIPAATEPTL